MLSGQERPLPAGSEAVRLPLRAKALRLLYYITRLICKSPVDPMEKSMGNSVKFCKIFKNFAHKNSFKKVLTTHMVFRIIIKHCNAELCNGSTCDSDSHCEGSNPSSATKRQRLLPFFTGYSADGSALRSGRRGLEFKSQYSDHTGTRFWRVPVFLFPRKLTGENAEKSPDRVIISHPARIRKAS